MFSQILCCQPHVQFWKRLAILSCISCLQPGVLCAFWKDLSFAATWHPLQVLGSQRHGSKKSVAVAGTLLGAVRERKEEIEKIKAPYFPAIQAA